MGQNTTPYALSYGVYNTCIRPLYRTCALRYSRLSNLLCYNIRHVDVLYNILFDLQKKDTDSFFSLVHSVYS